MKIAEAVRRPRTWFIAVPIIIFLGAVVAPFVYINFIKEDAEKPLSFDDLSSTSASSSGDSSSTNDPTTTVGDGTASGIDGTWTVAEGSQAGYRASEVLFGQDSTATARTSGVTGELTATGTTVSAASIEVDLTGLSSGEGGRDGQVQSRILETSTFPTATFELTEPIDLGEIPADQKEITASATGDLTIHGVTKSETFDLTLRRNGEVFEVVGTIDLAWSDFEISDPSGGPATVKDNGQMEFAISFAKA